jgi:hypothetical protein
MEGLGVMAEPVRIEDGYPGVVLAAEIKDGVTYQVVRLDEQEIERIARRVVELLQERAS